MSFARISVPMRGAVADANVQPRHPADAAAWIWHPACALGETAVVRFSLTFTVTDPGRHRIHVTADQRFQLRVDGCEVGYGPDRGEVEKWPVASYDLELAAGSHRLDALVWWLQDGTLTGLRADPGLAGASTHVRPPVAQATWRGGFLLAGEGALAEAVSTGRAAWQVTRMTASVDCVQPAFYAYHDIGPEFHVRGEIWNAPEPAVNAVVVAGPILGNPHGVQRPGWRSQAANLPEQRRAPVRGGKLRSLATTVTAGPFEEVESNRAEASCWRTLFSGEQEIVVPAASARTVLWDFEDYVCGYAQLATRGGAGAWVRIDWAEALHESDDPAAVTKDTPKGDRAQIAGKIMVGFGDCYFPAAGAIDFPSFWWRSGRFLRVQIRTQSEALVVTSLRVVSTGYPLGPVARFASSEARLNTLAQLSETTIRACAHEVWTDCPYYEQVAYVGDSRIAALNNYMLFADDRLSRRMIELFDDTRRGHGLVAERVPAAWQQVSVTYALIWVWMVRDFAWWRDDAAEVRTRLRGVRALLEEVLALTEGDALLHALPGWSFVDWVPEWHEGCGPGVREGDSSVVNLHLLLALRAHGELEEAFGEPELATLARRRAARLEMAVRARYWCPARGLLADTGARTDFSEHAQALGLLAGVEVPGGAERWIDNWLAASGLARATRYFSFYVMDALYRGGKSEAWFVRCGDWHEVPTTGLLTMPEAPEPTRSDCHGWSAHLRWHFAASLAGVRPAAPGFARVRVAPMLGTVETLTVEVWHPRGLIKVEFRRAGRRLTGEITLPENLDGELHWLGSTHRLRGGNNQIDAT